MSRAEGPAAMIMNPGSDPARTVTFTILGEVKDVCHGISSLLRPRATPELQHSPTLALHKQAQLVIL